MQTTGVIWDRESGIGFATRTLPAPQPGELLLEVGASGLCGTDLHIAAGEYPLAKSGVVLGHEYAGTVIEVGPGTPVFSVGDRVVVDPNIPCRMCTACREARPHLCANPQTLGVTIDGGLGTHSIVPADRAYRLPDSLPMAAAALTEPLACVVHAVDRAGLEPGHSALVIGAGPIGLLTASLLKAAGASSVCVSEPNERRRALAPAFGGIPIEPHDVPDERVRRRDGVRRPAGNAGSRYSSGAARWNGGVGRGGGSAGDSAGQPVRHFPAGDHDPRHLHKSAHHGSVDCPARLGTNSVAGDHYPLVDAGPLRRGVGSAPDGCRPEGVRAPERRFVVTSEGT